MKRKAVIILLACMTFLTACSGGGSSKTTENVTENNSAELKAEKEIQKELEEKYDKDFDIYYITEVDAGDIDFACYAHVDGDEDSQVSIYRLEDGTIQDNYPVLQYKTGIEDMVNQSVSGVDVFTEFTPNLVQLVEGREYSDISDYAKNGNYSLDIVASTDSSATEEDVIKGVTAFEQALKEFGLRHSITVNDYMVFDFNVNTLAEDTEINDDYVKQSMYIDETRREDYQNRIKEEQEMEEQADGDELRLPETDGESDSAE